MLQRLGNAFKWLAIAALAASIVVLAYGDEAPLPQLLHETVERISSAVSHIEFIKSEETAPSSGRVSLTPENRAMGGKGAIAPATQPEPQESVEDVSILSLKRKAVVGVSSAASQLEAHLDTLGTTLEAIAPKVQEIGLSLLHPQPLEDFTAFHSSCGANSIYWGMGEPPQEESFPAHPTNYGLRYRTDAYGKELDNQLLVVLHETVNSADSAINTFQVAHELDSQQVSYHDLIRWDGTVVHLVPLEMRAYGAGNSVFLSANGEETVVTNRALLPSVNNFAYHISLESPPNSWEADTHDGYSEAQYQSLAWLIARACIARDRIATHKAVDRSGTRSDPRSFDENQLFEALNRYPG